MNKKQRGYLAESIVLASYQMKNFSLIKKNFTIRGGEIDLIFSHDQCLIFVEVKSFFGDVDLYNYITEKKKKAMYRSIQEFLMQFPEYSDFGLRVDVVFVKNNSIFSVVENIDF